MLCAVLAGGHLKDVGYAQEGFQCVPVGHHLRTKHTHGSMRRVSFSEPYQPLWNPITSDVSTLLLREEDSREFTDHPEATGIHEHNRRHPVRLITVFHLNFFKYVNRYSSNQTVKSFRKRCKYSRNIAVTMIIQILRRQCTGSVTDKYPEVSKIITKAEKTYFEVKHFFCTVWLSLNDNNSQSLTREKTTFKCAPFPWPHFTSDIFIFFTRSTYLGENNKTSPEMLRKCAVIFYARICVSKYGGRRCSDA